MATTNWWNTSYPVRRNLKVTPKTGEIISAGHPLYVFFDKDQLITLGKLREDYQDLEILYYDATLATPAWSMIGRDVSYSSSTDLLSIVFNAYDDIDSVNTNYYVHMGNENLINFFQRPQYESSIYILTATPTNNSGLMFSRPTEDWNDGVSLQANARATLAFSGIHVRLNVEKGPDKGILEVKLDNEEAEYIDLYSSTTSEEAVFEANDLATTKHYLRMRSTGTKSPSSSGTSVKIVSVQYSKYIEMIDQGEEFYSTTGPLSVIVGL